MELSLNFCLKIKYQINGISNGLPTFENTLMQLGTISFLQKMTIVRLNMDSTTVGQVLILAHFGCWYNKQALMCTI